VALLMKLQSNGHLADPEPDAPLTDEELLQMVQERLNSNGMHHGIAALLNDEELLQTVRERLNSNGNYRAIAALLDDKELLQTLGQRLHSDGIHRGLAALLEEEELLQMVRERLNSNGSYRRIALVLNEWADFSAARVNMPTPRWQRVPHIARQLVKRRYHRFSHGFGSALRDLLRAPKPSGSAKSSESR
jgi:predicted component of type VI protein secretion system